MGKLVCFDMDMTLLDHRTYKIPDSAMEALSKLREKGHIIALASGRDMENDFSRPLAELVSPDAIVHNNGLKVTVGNEKVYERFMDIELVRELLEYGERHKVCIGYNLGNTAYYVHKEIFIAREEQLHGRCDRTFGDPAELLKTRLHALAMFGKKEQVRELEKAFPNLKFPMFSGDVGADIIDRKTSKAVGIKALIDRFRMGWEDVVAFGDSMNDMEMIRKAGCGIAMGNAIPQLKEAADFVTRPVDQDGVYYGLRHIGLL